MKNFKITIEYDGTEFVGWQRQPNGRSVQEEIERALEQITSSKTSVTGAGRTDSGVHARGQVANFVIEPKVSEEDLLRSINGLIADDIVVHAIEEVGESFSARYSAKEREYKYYISKRSTALNRHFCWLCGYDLDLSLMNQAAMKIIGSHDFKSFCRSETKLDHYLCSVFAAEWHFLDDNQIVFTIRANRFLHGMVRALVGTFVDVGRGFTPVAEFENILNSHNRQRAGQSAPAKGLFLERVVY